MKRSNRLVLLIGVFLAIIAFVGILVISNGGGGGDKGGSTKPPTELPTVVAKVNIPLGARIQSNQVETKTLAVTARDSGAFEDPSLVIGKIVRDPVTAGAQITTETFLSSGTIGNLAVPAGKRAMSVKVDQVTGVGTVIKTGDYVDLLVGFSGGEFPVITINPADNSTTVVNGLNSTSVKVLIQGLQVLGTLLPAPPASNNGSTPTPSPGTGTDTGGGTSTNFDPTQQQIVILAVDAQQAEILKFAELSGDTAISLALRSPDDFLDPNTKQPLPDGPVPDTTTGIILKALVDTYGVLPPELVETVLPAQASPGP